MRVLVFGVNGQVGSEIAHAFARFKNTAHIDLDVRGATRSDLDLNSLEGIKPFLVKMEPDFVINAAAYTSVDKAESEENLAITANASSVREIADYCRHGDVPLLHISTDYVFDGKCDEPYRESDEIGPMGVYGRSKFAGEQAVRELVSKHIILRTAWVFGVRGNNFVKTMLRLAKDKRELSIVADQVGAPTSSRAISVAIVGIVLQMLDADIDDERWGTYHFSGYPYASWADFADEIFNQACKLGVIGSSPAVNRIPALEYPTPAKRPANSRLDCSKLRNTFGIEPDDWKRSLAEMLRELEQEALH